MTRPPKPAHLKFSKMVPVKMTDAEWKELSTLAEAASVPLSQLMRDGARLLGSRLQKGKGRVSKGDEHDPSTEKLSARKYQQAKRKMGDSLARKRSK